ncbi:unnamed protein product [Heterobilharzia americana]|nr:unnamed protein product [Heterobilharzia americana]
MSLDVLLKCDFSEVDLPSSWIRKAVFCVPWNMRIVTIGLQDKMLIFGGLARNCDNFILLSELKFQSRITAINCLQFPSSKNNNSSEWNVFVVGLENGELIFLDENNKILLCIKVGFDSVKSMQLTSCGENLCVLNKTSIICLDVNDLEGVLLNSRIYLSEHFPEFDENINVEYSKTIRYRNMVVPTDGEKQHFSCLSKPQMGIFDSLVRKFAFGSHLNDGRVCVQSPRQTRWTTTGSNPFISFSFSNENTDPGVSHFASFVYQEAKRAVFGFKKSSSSDPESLVVTWSKQKDDFTTYPVVVCNSLSKTSLTLSHGLADSRRSVLSSSIAISFDHRWLAVPDNLGRVLLVDAHKERVVRIWKGYRDAEVAFLEVSDLETPSISYHSQPSNVIRKTLCLLIHVPNLHLLELWCLLHGPRIVSWDVVEPVRLIQTTCHRYVCTTESNKLNSKYCQMVLIDASGRVYSVALNHGLCLSDNNTEAAMDYQEYKVLQRIFEILEQSDNLKLEEFCHGVTNLLVQFRTVQWFERALTHLLSYPSLSPHLILDVIKLCIQLISKDGDIDKQVNSMNLKICTNVKYLVEFYLIFYYLYDHHTETDEKYEFTRESLSTCVEFIADLLSWDSEDAKHCLQLYTICASVLTTSINSLKKPISIQIFVNSFQYTSVSNTEMKYTSSALVEHSKQFNLPRIRSDSTYKTLTKIGSFVFTPYLNGLQTFVSLQIIIESSNLDPKLLLLSFTLFILNEDNYMNLPILIDRIHRIFCYLIYRILVGLLSSSSSLLSEKVEEQQGVDKNSENETNIYNFLDIEHNRSSQPHSKFDYICKQVYMYCLDSFHLTSAYLIALIMRCILFQVWQAFESGENILQILFTWIQRPDFMLNNSSVNMTAVDNDFTNQLTEFTKLSSNNDVGLKLSSEFLAYFTSNLQHLVDKWHQTCAQLEDILSVGLILSHSSTIKKESKDFRQCPFNFNLRCVLANGRSYITGIFASWIVKNNILPEQVLCFYQEICAKPLITDDYNGRDLAVRDPDHIRQVIFSLAYKRLPFTLELDTVLSTVCWIHFQIWRNKPEKINHLVYCIEFMKRFTSAGTMIVQGLGTMIWHKGLIDWFNPILAIARGGDKLFDNNRDCFPNILDVSMCLIEFFKIYSNACQRAEVVPIFSVEAEWSHVDIFDNKSLQFSVNNYNDKNSIDIVADLDAQCSTAEGIMKEISPRISYLFDDKLFGKFSVQDAINQPIPKLSSVNSWEQLVIVASALIVFGRPEKPDKLNQYKSHKIFYSPSDFFPSQDLYVILSPDDPNWTSAAIVGDVDDHLGIRRRFFLSWLIERCVARLALSPNSSLQEHPTHSANYTHNRTFPAVEVYRLFSSAALTLANHWGFPKDTVITQHVVSLFEVNLDDQAQLMSSSANDLEVCQDSQFNSETIDLKTLVFLIDYVIQHLPQHASQLSIAEELRDIIQAIVQLDSI